MKKNKKKIEIVKDKFILTLEDKVIRGVYPIRTDYDDLGFPVLTHLQSVIEEYLASIILNNKILYDLKLEFSEDVKEIDTTIILKINNHTGAVYPVIEVNYLDNDGWGTIEDDCPMTIIYDNITEDERINVDFLLETLNDYILHWDVRGVYLTQQLSPKAVLRHRRYIKRERQKEVAKKSPLSLNGGDFLVTKIGGIHKVKGLATNDYITTDEKYPIVLSWEDIDETETNSFNKRRMYRTFNILSEAMYNKRYIFKYRDKKALEKLHKYLYYLAPNCRRDIGGDEGGKFIILDRVKNASQDYFEVRTTNEPQKVPYTKIILLDNLVKYFEIRKLSDVFHGSETRAYRDLDGNHCVTINEEGWYGIYKGEKLWWVIDHFRESYLEDSYEMSEIIALVNWVQRF